MIDKIQHITVNDIEYPFAFTLNVMELVQEKYGSMDEWINAIDSEEPKIKDVIWTFTEFINEGIDIENEEKGETREFLTHKQVGRLITDFGIKEASETIQETTVKSTKTKNPNSKTTKSQIQKDQAK